MLSKLFEDIGELLIMGQEITMAPWKILGRIRAGMWERKGFHYGNNSMENVDDQNAFTFWEMSEEIVIRGTVDLPLYGLFC